MSNGFAITSSFLLSALAAGMTSYTFDEGEPPDTLPPSSIALGFIWIDGHKQNDQNKLVEFITAMVRLYPIQEEQFDGTTPISPSLLYQVVEDLQTTIKASSTGGDPWIVEVVASQFDHKNQFVDVEIMATRWNDAMPT